jgi:hypothetical protein
MNYVMKYIKSYILLALMVLAVTGCKQEDLKDDVNALKDRVTLLEEQEAPRFPLL